MDPEEFVYQIKIPRERIAIVIGKEGEVKRDLERSLSCKLAIDSKEGDITISGGDSLNMFLAKEIITAIGRGFNPEIAMLLRKADFGIEVVPITDYTKTKKDLIRLRGRIIGEEGRSRRVLEELTETRISVYGKTASIIGELQWIPVARKAIESLLLGANHASVYKMLERKRSELRRKALFDQFSPKEKSDL